MRTLAEMTNEELTEHKRIIIAFLYLSRELSDVSEEIIRENFAFSEELDAVEKVERAIFSARNRLNWRHFSILAEEWARKQKQNAQTENCEN